MTAVAKEFALSGDAVGLEFAGGIRALSGVTFGIERGEFVSIVGPSGCGKSTLLRLVSGLLDPTEGTVQTAGHAARDVKERRDAGFVFQQPTLLPWRTVEQNVALPGELGPSPKRIDPARVRAALELVGLSDFARVFPHQLSGGMQMRVSLARALVTEPGVLLMDEPFAALDEITRQKLNEDLLTLWARDKWTGLFVTHNVVEAVFLSQRVFVMSARPGRIVEEIVIPFAYPRAPELRATAEFAALSGRVSAALRAVSE